MISTQLGLLNLIPFEDINAFYVVTLWKGRLELQGHLTRQTIEIAKSLSVTLTWNANILALEGQTENIRICLTADL